MNDLISKKIFDLVRKSIDYYFINFKYYLPNSDGYKEKEFLEKRGVFVTIKMKGNLRGCIGNIEPDEVVYKLIAQNAIDCAFNDPRFAPLTKEEYEDCKFEVSILTKLEKFDYTDKGNLIEFLKKRHPGIIIEKYGVRATFLPSVWEEISSPEEFMMHLCLKAGLEPDEWMNNDMRIEYYFADKYEE